MSESKVPCVVITLEDWCDAMCDFEVELGRLEGLCMQVKDADLKRTLDNQSTVTNNYLGDITRLAYSRPLQMLGGDDLG